MSNVSSLHRIPSTPYEDATAYLRRWRQYEPGDAIDIPVDLAYSRSYVFRTIGYQSFDLADWAVEVDGVPLETWRGYAPTPRRVEGAWSSPVGLERGRHTLTFRCVGRDPASRGTLGFFDYVEAVEAP